MEGCIHPSLLPSHVHCFSGSDRRNRRLVVPRMPVLPAPGMPTGALSRPRIRPYEAREIRRPTELSASGPPSEINGSCGTRVA